MVGQISFYVFCCCVVRMDGFVQNRINEFVQRQLRRQDGWFCAKLDGWAWAATFWPFLAVFTTQQHHRLNMRRLGEHVHRLNRFDLIALLNITDVASQSRAIARNIDNPRGA